MRTTHKIAVWLSGTCLMAALVGISFYTFRQIGEADTWRKHSHKALGEAEKLLIDLKDAETNQRDYLLTGYEAVLAIYLEARNDIDNHLAELRRLTSYNTVQQRRLDVIASLAEARLDLLKQAIELRRKQDSAAVLEFLRSGRGRDLMGKISVELAGFIEVEEELREQHNVEFELYRHRMLMVIIVGSLIVVLFIMLAAYLLYREVGGRVDIQEKINKELDRQVKERTEALDDAIQSLSNSNSQLETILENITEGVAVSDLSGQLFFFNRAALDMHCFGTLDECRMHLAKLSDIFELTTLDGTIVQVEQWPLSRILRGELLHNLEMRIRHLQAGWQRVFNYGGTIVRDIGGQPLMAIVTIQDITERKQAEVELLKLNANLEQRVAGRTEELNRVNAELIHANRAKDSFLATMSHEIRTPLSGMLGMLELLSLTQFDKEQKKTLQAARESGNSLLRILSDILDWSKIEANKLGLSPQATSLKLLLQEVVTTYSHIASAKGLELRHHVDVRLSPAHLVDSLRLSQILNNFVSNAIKFTKKGEVEVRADLLERSNGGEQVRFSVRDTGIGIEPEQQAALFQDFTQATAGTARMYGGTGLGLAISRRLLDLMQGRIDLVSAPGQGSTFSVTLTMPVTEMGQEQSAAAGADALLVQPIVQDGANAPTVLVVDDHPINLALLVRQVELLGLRARNAEDGEMALELWREGGVSLVITDVHMPKMDGYELTAAIRSIEIAEARPRTPIIANTANALNEEQERCRDAGMDEVIVKPATLSKLRTTLLHWLPELSDIAAETPVHEAGFDDADAPIDHAELRNIIPDRAGQIALLRKFQAHQHSDLDKLKAELDKGDLAGMVLTAHRIKGASRMAGAKELAAAYAAIEQAAKQNDLESARAAMLTLSAAVDWFETYIRGLTDTKEKTYEDK